MKALYFIPILLSSILLADNINNNIEDTSSTSTIDLALDKIEYGLDSAYKGINYSSKLVDEFLTNQYDDTTYKDSYFSLEYTFFKQEGSSLNSDPKVGIKVKLPKLEKNLSLVIKNTPDKVNEQYQDTNEESNNKNSDTSVGLLFDTVKDTINLKFNAGAKFSKNAYLFTKAEATKEFLLNSSNTILLGEKLEYSTKNKLDNYTTFEYKYLINKKLSLINYNEYYINSAKNIDSIYNSIRLYDYINKNKYLNYVISVNSDNNNSQLNAKHYSAYTSYRQYVRKWFYYDLIPQINWDSSNNFDTNYGFRFNLGFVMKK